MPKTKNSYRTIPICDKLLNDLQKLYSEVSKYKNFPKSFFVFSKDGGLTPVSENYIRDNKNKICNLAGLRAIRIHDFRHSCASLLINKGANITIVSKYLGHAKIDETLNTYSHIFQNKLDDVVNTINNLNE